MAKPLTLGVLLNYNHLSDGRYTVAQDEALKFIEGLNLAESIVQAVSIIPVEKINPENYNIVLEEREITVFPLPNWENAAQNVLSLFLDFSFLSNKIRRFVEGCDIIWLRVPSLIGILLWWVAKKKRKPLIVHVAGNLLLAPKRPKHKGLMKPLAHLFFFIYHLFVKIISRYGLLLTAGGELEAILSSPLHPAYAVDDVLIKDHQLQPAKKKKGQATQILFVGRFDHGKGIEILIEAIKILKSEFPETCLIMAGEGILLDEMRRYVKIQGLTKNVKILGFVSSSGPLQELYKKADIAVLPSDSFPEGFPRVILEFWAAGLPLVATRLGGIPYRVKHCVNGLLVPPGDLKSLTDAIRNLIINPGLRNRIAEGGTQTIKELTYKKQIEKVKKLVKSRYPRLFESKGFKSKKESTIGSD